MTNVLSILDIKDDIEVIINLGLDLKKEIKSGKKINSLNGKIMAMVFDRESTRTRCSFEVGMYLLGGHSIFIRNNKTGFGDWPSIADISRILSNYVDIILYRPIGKENLYEFAENAKIPVINGLDYKEHPCQILSDLMTIKEKKGYLDNLDFVFVGDGDNNLAHSYLLGCSMVGMNVTIISPKDYWPDISYVKKAESIFQINNRFFKISENIENIRKADVVATDTWVSYWDEQNRDKRLRDFEKYRVTDLVLNKTHDDAIFLHCMPIYYKEEVEKKVVYGNNKSVVFDQAENRLYSQMALIKFLLR